MILDDDAFTAWPPVDALPRGKQRELRIEFRADNTAIRFSLRGIESIEEVERRVGAELE